MSGNEAEQFEEGNEETRTLVSDELQDLGSQGSHFNYPLVMARIKSLLTEPDIAWATISQEKTSLKDSLMTYYLPVAIISSVCSLIGMTVFGISMFGATVRASFFPALIQNIASLALVLAAPFIAGQVNALLAPKFGGHSDTEKNGKVYLFALTPVLAAGVLNIIPILSILTTLVGIYCLYIYYKGLTPMTGVEESKRMIFGIASIVCIMVSLMVVSLAINVITPNPYPQSNIIDTNASISEIMENSGIEINEEDMKKATEMMGAFQKMAQEAAEQNQ